MNTPKSLSQIQKTLKRRLKISRKILERTVKNCQARLVFKLSPKSHFYAISDINLLMSDNIEKDC